MNRDQISYFEMLYKEQNIIRAAARVPMSTQGLGKSIRALEREFEVPLFEIKPNGGRTPTPYAHALAIYVKHMHAARKKLKQEFDRISKENADEAGAFLEANLSENPQKGH